MSANTVNWQTYLDMVSPPLLPIQLDGDGYPITANPQPDPTWFTHDGYDPSKFDIALQNWMQYAHVKAYQAKPSEKALAALKLPSDITAAQWNAFVYGPGIVVTSPYLPVGYTQFYLPDNYNYVDPTSGLNYGIADEENAHDFVGKAVFGAIVSAFTLGAGMASGLIGVAETAGSAVTAGSMDFAGGLAEDSLLTQSAFEASNISAGLTASGEAIATDAAAVSIGEDTAHVISDTLDVIDNSAVTSGTIENVSLESTIANADPNALYLDEITTTTGEIFTNVPITSTSEIVTSAASQAADMLKNKLLSTSAQKALAALSNTAKQTGVIPRGYTYNNATQQLQPTNELLALTAAYLATGIVPSGYVYNSATGLLQPDTGPSSLMLLGILGLAFLALK